MSVTLLSLVGKIKYLVDLVFYAFSLRKKKSFRMQISGSGKPTLMHALCDLHGSDKGSALASSPRYPWPPHTYADYYALRFGPAREKIQSVFECGVGTGNFGFPANMGKAYEPGASLRVWRDYFPNATVYGADIDADVLFSEERISTVFVDQTDESSINAMWSRIPINEFDLIVDDGLHEFRAGICLFENSSHRLARTGVWVIEDVTLSDAREYLAYFEDKDWVIEVVDFQRPGFFAGDNRLVVITRLGSR